MLSRLLMLAIILSASLLLKSAYLTNLLNVIALQALPVIGLALLMGYTGQISLGHAAFYGLGAYGAALLSLRAGLSPWLGIPIAAAFAGLVGWGLGWLVFRLRGHHLAMATLAFGVIFHVGLVELAGLTGGPNGLAGIPPLSLFGHALSSDFLIFPVVWLACLGAMLVASNLVRSPLGLSMRAVGENERVAASLGNDVRALKRTVLAISAVLAAAGGGLYAHYIGYLSPGPFDIGFSIRLLVMMAVGGFANVWGVLFGVAFVTIIAELLKPLGQFDVIAYGLMLVVVMIFCPEGLLGGAIRLVRKCNLKGAGRVA